MKIKYEFVKGTELNSVVEVDVPEKVGSVIVDLDRREYNNDHKETRRHCSLEAYNLDDNLIPSGEDVETDVIAKIENERLYEAIQHLTERQRMRRSCVRSSKRNGRTHRQAYKSK